MQTTLRKKQAGSLGAATCGTPTQMGFTFHNVDDRPTPFDIVWCKWPNRGQGLRPGPVARPVIVIHSEAREIFDTQTKFGWLVIQYGGDFNERDKHMNLHIGTHEFRDLGLHKETVFRFDLGNRKALPWCEEYFVTQGYVKKQNLVCGRLNREQEARALACFAVRELEYPVPLGK